MYSKSGMLKHIKK